jgi:predicted nucleic acid-binding protein
LAAAGVEILVPEIADYEVRRELIRAGKSRGLARLDALGDRHQYLPVTTQAMRRAAELWAEARRRGRPTADASALDVDVILAAQASLLLETDDDVVVATTNVRHLAQFVPARRWQEIIP